MCYSGPPILILRLINTEVTGQQISLIRDFLLLLFTHLFLELIFILFYSCVITDLLGKFFNCNERHLP